MDKCEECNKELGKPIWAFQTTGDGISLYEHDYCSEECANKGIAKLEQKGYKPLKLIVDTGTNES